MDIHADKLQGKHANLARIIGIDRFLTLCELYGGTRIYIPKKDRLCQKVRDMEIKHSFDGRNYKQLAARYSLSARRVRQIVDEFRLLRRQKK